MQHNSKTNQTGPYPRFFEGGATKEFIRGRGYIFLTPIFFLYSISLRFYKSAKHFWGGEGSNLPSPPGYGPTTKRFIFSFSSLIKKLSSMKYFFQVSIKHITVLNDEKALDWKLECVSPSEFRNWPKKLVFMQNFGILGFKIILRIWPILRIFPV